MRRCRRVLSLLCGVLAILTAIAWQRSYRAYDQVGRERYTFTADHFYHRQFSLASVRGQFIAHQADNDITFDILKFIPATTVEEFERRPAFFHRAFPANTSTAWSLTGGSTLNRMGFAYAAGIDTTPVVYDTGRRTSFNYWSQAHPMGRTLTYRTIVIPHWFVLLVLLPLPLRSASRLPARARAVRSRRRIRRGHCGACDYDLRATPGRCPECGAMPESKPSHAQDAIFAAAQTSKAS